MSVLRIVKRLPEYAADVKNNLIELFSGNLEGLSKKQVYSVALATAYCLNNEEMLNDIRNEAKIYLNEDDAIECKLSIIFATSACTYNKFVNYSNNKELSDIKANFHNEKMQDIENKTTVLFYCLIVAIINNSPIDIEENTKKLLEKKVSPVAVSNVVKIVSVLKSASTSAKIESISNYDFLPREQSF